MRYLGSNWALWMGDLVAHHRSERRLAGERPKIPANKEPDETDDPISAFDASDLDHLLSDDSLCSF